MYPTAAQFDNRDLARRTAEFLESRHISGISQLDIHADSGVIVVQGYVTAEPARGQCLACCRHVAGVIQVIDQLQSAPRDDRDIPADK